MTLRRSRIDAKDLRKLRGPSLKLGPMCRQSADIWNVVAARGQTRLETDHPIGETNANYIMLTSRWLPPASSSRQSRRHRIKRHVPTATMPRMGGRRKTTRCQSVSSRERQQLIRSAIHKSKRDDCRFFTAKVADEDTRAKVSRYCNCGFRFTHPSRASRLEKQQSLPREV